MDNYKEKSKKVPFYIRAGYLLTAVFVVLVGFTIVGFLESDDEEGKDFTQEFLDEYGVYALTIPEQVDFAGENVPLENFDVKESLDMEILVNTYWHSRTFLMLKRSNRYFPVIEKILAEEGVPDDFKYLAVAESGLENAISPANAVGFWQFLKGTAKEYGLEVNEEVDERYHLEKATRAACRYFKKSYQKFQSWTLVAASYNMGRSALLKQMARQDAHNYYDLLLNEETARYVFRIVGYKLVMTNPRNYGFHIRKQDLYPPVETEDIIVNSSIDDMARFAKQHHTNYKILKYFNPWLRDNKLANPAGKEYIIKVPVKGARKAIPPSLENIDSLLKDTGSIDLDTI